jgi:hypothetical protein
MQTINQFIVTAQTWLNDNPKKAIFLLGFVFGFIIGFILL